MKKLQEMKPFKRYAFIICFALISVVLSTSATYAWFSSVLTNIDGSLNLGSLSATAHIYENNDDSQGNDNYIDGLTDVVSLSSTGTAINTYDLIQKPWYSQQYTSIYIEIENTGTIDLKSILKLSFDNTSLLTYLSYYYYHMVNITEDVEAYVGSTPREKLSAYNEDYQDGIQENLSTYINNITSNGFCIASNLPVVNMGTTAYNAKTFYRLDIAMAEIPTELLTAFNALPVEQREIQLNGILTIKQTNAPDDNNEESGVSVYVSTSDAFIYAINSAGNGDTIYLNANLSVANNLTITHRVNIVLNGYTLIINGTLAYDLAGTGTTTLDVSDSSYLYVYRDFIIDTPNGTFKIIGSGGGAQSIILGDGVTSEAGNFYINCLKDDNNVSTYGYYQYGVSIMKKLTTVTSALATLTIDSNTRATIGLGSKTGPIVSSNDASNIELYNNGEIKSIDFSNMHQLSNTNVQLYIYNSNKFTDKNPAIILPTWSLGWKSKQLQQISNAINTRIINGSGSDTMYSVSGSLVFVDNDIENMDVATDSVIDLNNNNYRVNVEPSVAGGDILTIDYYLAQYYFNLNNNATQTDYETWLATINGLTIYTYNATVVKTIDFTFINNYLTNLASLDLTYSSIVDNTIPASAFYNKTSLEAVYFPISELSIGDNAFYGTSLNTITLSGTIISIGTNAFDINTSQNGLLKIFYEGENVTALLGYISNLTADKTLLFMSPSNLTSFKANYAITDTWYINSYANYDFIDEYLNYYRIIDGSSVEIVYYAGNWNNLNILNTVSYNIQSFRVVGISSSAYRRAINGAGTNSISISMPNNMTYIKSDAFYNAYITNLNLNVVSNIGAYAFYNATILTSSARPTSFYGMTSLGAYAFSNVKIGTTGTTSLVTFELANVTNGAIKNSLDLRGNYAPGEGAFSSASFYGVALNLNYVLSITSGMTNNLSLYGCELYLNNVTEIGDSAFESRFKSYDELYPYNKVIAKNVKTIGRLSFKGMYVNQFTIGISTLYLSQSEVNTYCSYGGTTSGMIYSDFNATNLLIDGMLPQISSGKASFLFGSETAGRIYTNVTIKNTNGLLYDFMFYGLNDVSGVTITNLYLYDITTIGDYALYYANVTNVYSYSGPTLLANNLITTIGDYAFRYSDSGLFGAFNLTRLEPYAFADCIVPSNSITINGTVGDYAFYNAKTTLMDAISLNGTIGNNVLYQAYIYTVENIYISGTIGQYLFRNAIIYDCTNITFEDIRIKENSFLNTIIYSACTIDTLGTCSIATLAFYNINASTSVLDLTNCLSIDDAALKKIIVLTVRLGNSTFLNTRESSFIYGTANGGLFTKDQASTITNLYIDGELPTQRLGNYILGADGANINITNIYITENCTNIPDYTFYSTSVSGCLTVTNFYIESDDLAIGEYAFHCISVSDIIYNAADYGEISFAGEYAFRFATIGDFTNFTYYDSVELKNMGVIKDITPYTFEYTTFGQDSNLTMFNYASMIGDYAFDHATFTPTSGGAKVSFDFTRVPTIGHSIFKNIYSPLGTITLGNTDYYNASLPGYYYGNTLGSEGIFGNSGTISIEQIIIAGNLPTANVNEMYQTRALGLSGNSSLTIGIVTINSGVTVLSDYCFSGYSTAYKTAITTLNIYSSNLSVGVSAFAYTNITTTNIFSSDVQLNTNSFAYSILTTINYDRTNGVGDITFDEMAEYTFKYATIYNITGFTSEGTGVVESIGKYAFYNAIFGVDCNLLWIQYVKEIKDCAFMYTTFTKTSSNQFVSLDLRNVITLGDEIFAFIPVHLGSLTLGNSTYAGIYGDDYYYGSGVNGVLYAAGQIDNLNIVGNLPIVNSTYALGNKCTETLWAVKYGTITISASVTNIPSSVFRSYSRTVPVIIGTLNMNATEATIGTSAFYYAQITLASFANTTLTIGTNSFYGTTITTLRFNASTINLGTSAFENSIISTMSYIGSTSGVITMTGERVFANASFNFITGFTYTVDVTSYTVVSNISDYAFENAVFAQNCVVTWIQYVSRIGAYAFSGTTFTKTSTNNYVDLNLTKVLTIEENAFFQLPISLGIVTIGNDSYSSNPYYAYGNNSEGIFNNVGTIQQLIIEGNLPNSEYAFGNRTSNISYLTTYLVVTINSNITSLPKGLFAGTDAVYATTITNLNISSTNLAIGEQAFNNVIITNFITPNNIVFNGVGANAFNSCSITNINPSYPNRNLSIMGDVGAYAFYGFNFSNYALNVNNVTYIGEYAFSYMTYDDSLTFNVPITLIDGNYMFAYANLSGNLTFNAIRSLGSNGFDGLISGTNVTYTFIFDSCLEVTSDYAFANMNGGGSAYISINGLPTLNSYRAFYNSTNIITIVFNETLLNLNEDNIFESASNLVSISLNNPTYVVVVNETIVTIPSQVKVYVPGTLLSSYLMDTYWSLITNQISTTYNIETSRLWGFYILGNSYNASICKYLGSSSSVIVPTTITYDSQTYTVTSLGPDVFLGTPVTTISIPNSLQNVDMDLFSNSNIENVSFTGAITGNEPFYIYNSGGIKIIYESSVMSVIYKYLPTNTATTFDIPDSVVEIAEKAFYKNDYLQSITFSAGQAQSGNSNSYITDYPSNLTLARYAIAENSVLTNIYLRNNSSGFGIILTSYAISENPVLANITIIGFQSIINSFAIYNNTALSLVILGPCTAKPFGSSGSELYASVYIQPYSFFGSGKTDGTTVFYTRVYKTFILSHAFSNSLITIFEFNINVSVAGYEATVYHPDAFAVGVNVEINGNGDIVQTYENVVIKVPSTQLALYRAARGFIFYYSSITGVSSFPNRSEVLN